MFKRKTFVISERDPVYKVRYLGNVLTAFVKGEGCVDKPVQVLWNNYLTSCVNNPSGTAGLEMEMTICASGLKVVTKEQGLTEYRAHRITYSLCPTTQTKLFVWVYRHEGKKFKPEVRCHAALCKTDVIAKTIATQLRDRRATALDEFRREKKRRQNSRLVLSRANSVPVEATCSGGGSVRTKFLKTGQNFRPSIDRTTSAPKLGSIVEGIEEEPSTEEELTSPRRSSLFTNVGRHPRNGWDQTERNGAEGIGNPVTFRIGREYDDVSNDHTARSVNGSLTTGMLALKVDGGACNDDITEDSIVMLPGAGVDADSDDSSNESGFSEQDGTGPDS